MLVLTCHKISAGEAGARADFYTVSRDQLTRHARALEETGWLPTRAEVLRADSLPPGRHFLLTFDDATEDHYEVVFPWLQEREWRAVFFVPTAKLNQPKRLTDAQVCELAQAGHAIGLHGHEHRRLDTLGDDAMREQFQRSRDRLGNLTGSAPWIFAPPGGFLNEHLREVALGFGVRVIRTMRWGCNRVLDPTALETIPLNRHTDDDAFKEILAGRPATLTYHGKELVKSLVPARVYERLRGLRFKSFRLH